MTTSDYTPGFLARLAPWERRFSRKFRVELIHRMNEILEEKRMSQREVAERAGWKEPFVSRLLGGDQNLTLKTVARFEEAVGADVLEVPLPTHATQAQPVKEVLPTEKKKMVDAKSIFRGVEDERDRRSRSLAHCHWRADALPGIEAEIEDVY